MAIDENSNKVETIKPMCFEYLSEDEKRKAISANINIRKEQEWLILR